MADESEGGGEWFAIKMPDHPPWTTDRTQEILRSSWQWAAEMADKHPHWIVMWVVAEDPSALHLKHFYDGYPLCWGLDREGEFLGTSEEIRVTCRECLSFMTDT